MKVTSLKSQIYLYELIRRMLTQVDDNTSMMVHA